MPAPEITRAPGMATLTLTVNGRERRVAIEPQRTLLEVLRADLGLTGAKECCLVGECGACTVILDGRSVDSCLVLALEADGSEVLTVEGLARDGRLDALQQAFLDHAAAQCGFCIPGQLVAARALLRGNANPSRADVADGLAGNLCRCAGYEQIIDAVLDAAQREAGRATATADGTVTTEPTSSRQDEGRPDPASIPDARMAPQ